MSFIIKSLPTEALSRLAEIDRSEDVRLNYTYENGAIQAHKVDLQAPAWSAERIAAYIAELTPELEQGGVLLGALDGDRLAGVAVLGNRFLGRAQNQLQLVFLHVSREYRRQGVASQLFAAAANLARQRGAQVMYISATESESAVGFYLSQGCQLAPEVDPDLYAKEPEDIHLIKVLADKE